MARILVTEEIAQGGLDRLRLAGHEVDVQTELSREQFLAALPGWTLKPSPPHRIFRLWVGQEWALTTLMLKQLQTVASWL
jgi:hypothetical protein